MCVCVQDVERTRVSVGGIVLQNSQNSHRLMLSGSAADTDVRAMTGLFCVLISVINHSLSTGDVRLTDASPSCKRNNIVCV